MYLNFFNLKRDPFQMTPDPAFMFLSPSHQKALNAIKNGVDKKKDCVLVVGAVGVGKTTVLRVYLEKMKEEATRAIYILNPNVQYNSLLKCILRELGIPTEPDNTAELTEQLRLALMEEGKEGRSVLLIIDEAQNLPLDTLQKLRPLVGRGACSDHPMQIVFSAQPEFENTLALQELKELKQRIAVKTTILPLTLEESEAYIRHRLKAAAEQEAEIFSQSAVREIVRNANGIPRMINVICDNCLFRAFSYGKKHVNREIAREITCDYCRSRPFPIMKAAAGFALVSSLLFCAYLGSTKAVYAKPMTAAVAKYRGMGTAYLHALRQKGDSFTKSFINGCDREADKAITFVKRVASRINLPPPPP